MDCQGFLAIWTDIERLHFVEYRHWLTREHIAQRIFAPGFLCARVHVAPENELSHFILYATEGRNVLGSRPYLEVLNNPSPWTQRMMPRLRNFDRGAGEQVAKFGDGAGAWLVVSRVSHDIEGTQRAALERKLEAIYSVEGAVTARLFAVDRNTTGLPTKEKTMRGGAEGAFRSLLVVEAMSENAAAAAGQRTGDWVKLLFGPNAEHDVGLFRSVYTLHPFDASTSRLSGNAERYATACDTGYQ